MGRIFNIQAKDVQTFRRKKRRKLKKGDVVRIFQAIPDKVVRKELDLRPQTKDILFSKNTTNKLTVTGSTTVVEIGVK